ncbi:hypothetical protein KIH31_01040 [Paenarthrobacter sp. DKR-5]|uniref:hypothetical protein n=1 Tax=Paenarthrobacter sp. DKR-5 TaxID=2835535 RepID=UPI001BDCD4C2|nr:hypothetical protein [Paenarthrobacter sp. DKR-5]MBT1001173.1 hypothetical protein [Paenarthrobacter sp. DKR-5]
MSTAQARRRPRTDLAARAWTGTVREYDLFKELVVGLVVVGLLVLGISAAFGSPDEASVTLKTWAAEAPADFVATATAELGGTSDTAGYGPPYNSTSDASQKLGPLDLQSFSGVRLPVDTANDFVIGPLKTLPSPPAALSAWTGADDKQRTDWAAAYADALSKAPDNDPAKVAPGNYGPVPALTAALLGMAKDGTLDGVLQSGGSFYNLDYTRSILFMGDGGYFPGLADGQHLTGDQWGMMNETGNYPGQSWLWLFSFWYQVEPIKSASNADLLAVLLMVVLTLLLTFLPFIPGLRSIPRWIPVHRLIWKDYYRRR